MITLCRDCLTLLAETAEVCPHCGAIRFVTHPELLTLSVAHIDCDSFYASVEKRDRPDLYDKPLIVGRASGRGVVTTACYLARRFGVHSAMPMFKALELCPQATILPPDMNKYKQVSGQIRSYFLAATPQIEPLSLDEAYLDLDERYRHDPRAPAIVLADIAQRIEQDVGVSVSIGLSYNKALAKLASDMNKPRGFSVIGRHEAQTLLAALPVEKIHGVGKAAARRLHEEGITTVRQLQETPEARLISLFGKFGRHLAACAHGEDRRKITPNRPTKSISNETTFLQDVRDLTALGHTLHPLCERVAARLKAAALGGSTIVLKLKTADFRLLSRNHSLPYPTQQAETIFQWAHHLLEKEADGRAFRLIGVGVADLEPGHHSDPPDLFSLPQPSSTNTEKD